MAESEAGYCHFLMNLSELLRARSWILRSHASEGPSEVILCLEKVFSGWIILCATQAGAAAVDQLGCLRSVLSSLSKKGTRHTQISVLVLCRSPSSMRLRLSCPPLSLSSCDLARSMTNCWLGLSVRSISRTDIFHQSCQSLRYTSFVSSSGHTR